MGIPQAVTGAVYGVAALVLLAACADDDRQTRQVGDYFVTVTTDPAKLEVGHDAAVTARISRDDEGVEGCRVSFRQYMPAHQMTTDHSLHVMESLGKGLYRGRGSEFSMGGDWELEFQFNCGSRVKTVAFPYNLVWM
jgi:hypothetical protein